MKKIFVMAALSLAAISCTKSDVLDSPVLDQEISFNTYLGKAPVSKATIQDNTSVKEGGYTFTVKAIKHWPGQDNNYTVEELSKQLYMDCKLSFNNNWVYDGNPVYWPTDGSSLRFVAFGDNAAASGNNADGLTVKENSNTVFQYKVHNELAQQQDLIVANTEVLGLEEGNPPVTLNFKHMLSRIGFSLVSNSATQVTIKSLQLEGDFKTTATIDLLGDELKLSAEETDKVTKYDIITSNSIFTPQFKTEGEGDEAKQVSVNLPIIQAVSGEGQQADIKNRYLMIIPQEATGITGAFTIGSDPTVRPIKIDLTKETKLSGGFLAGKAYEFVLNVKTYEISFNVNVVDWDENGNTFNQEI